MSVSDNAIELEKIARRIRELENRAGHADADGEGNRFAGKGPEDKEDNEDETTAGEVTFFDPDDRTEARVDDLMVTAREGVHNNLRRYGAAESVKKKRIYYLKML